jgi:glycosyltransferase 2 family protein
MKSKKLKRVLLVGKILLALCLLGWVLSKAHWNDYVQLRPEFGGKTWTLTDGGSETSEELSVSRGMLWWKESREVSRNQIQSYDPESKDVIRRGIKNSFEDIRLWWILLTVAGFGLTYVIVAFRWWYLLRVLGVKLPLWEVMRLAYLGLFFNNIVPGTVGGDLVKAWYVSKHEHKTAGVLVSIFLDRILGLMAMAIIAAVMLCVVLLSGWESLEKMRPAAITVAIVGGLLVGALGFLLSDTLRRWFHLDKIYKRLPIAHHFEAAGEAVNIYRQRIGSLVLAVCMTFVAHLCMFCSIAFLGSAMGMDTAVFTFLVYLPLIYILGAVPITPGGVGIVENLYVEAFRTVTVGASTIIALAMLTRLILILWSLPGLIVAITGPKLPKASEMEAELEKAEEKEMGESVE